MRKESLAAQTAQTLRRVCQCEPMRLRGGDRGAAHMHKTYVTRCMLVITRQRKCGTLAFASLLLSTSAAQSGDARLVDLIELGKRIFFDKSLSLTGTQSCASCHAPEVGLFRARRAFQSNGRV